MFIYWRYKSTVFKLTVQKVQGVFFFLLDRLTPAQRSSRLSGRLRVEEVEQLMAGARKINRNDNNLYKV